MAVIDGIPGLEAWVCVNGKRAKEYDPDNDVEEVNPSMTTKYIESVRGASFSLHFKVNRTYKLSSKDYVLGVYYKLDGVKEWSTVSKRNEENSVHYRRSFDARGREIRERFQFGDIKTVETLEKRRVAEDRAIASKLGVIQIEVYRWIQTRERVVEETPQQRDATVSSSSNSANQTSSTVETKTSDQTLEIAEKALKGRAISNLVSFGPAEIVEDSSESDLDEDEDEDDDDDEDELPERETPPRKTIRWVTKYHSHPADDDQPIAVYKFLYRSMDDLRMMQIVPADASTLLLGTLSETEIRKLAKAHLDQVNAAKPKKKRSLKRRHAEVTGADED